MHHYYKLLILSLLLSIPISANAQQTPTPEGAFIRSLMVPGWGHFYVNQNQWTRGQIHFGAEIALAASYFGFSIRADNLENEYKTLARLKAGVDISNRSRTFQLALGDFDTLQEYNDFQLRSRNWNRLFDDESENRWNWEGENDRDQYNSLRSNVDRVRNQLPAILGLMVVNRVISAVSAYNRAKNYSNIPEVTFLPFSDSSENIGVLAHINFRF